jgi:hypothetical protein
LAGLGFSLTKFSGLSTSFRLVVFFEIYLLETMAKLFGARISSIVVEFRVRVVCMQKP